VSKCREGRAEPISKYTVLDLPIQGGNREVFPLSWAPESAFSHRPLLSAAPTANAGSEAVSQSGSITDACESAVGT
jgi:hypothetical protein